MEKKHDSQIRLVEDEHIKVRLEKGKIYGISESESDTQICINLSFTYPHDHHVFPHEDGG